MTPAKKWRLEVHPEAGAGLTEREIVTRVDVFGEVGDWRNGIELRRGSLLPGFSVAIDLPPGVYQYKLLSRWANAQGGAERTEWMLDPANPRTRSSQGLRNSVVVIDGAPEPWLFAPAPPWVEEMDRGGLRIFVGLRRDAPRDPKTAPAAPAAVTISWSEDDGATWSSGRAAHVFDEDEHAFFSLVIPTSAPSTKIAVEEADGGRFEASYTRRAASERLPAWWKRAVIYGVLVDRFRPESDHAGWERDPARRTAAGGHLEGIRRSLDDLRELGVDTLYLTPVHVGATAAHRYDLVDPLKIDPALGGEEAYRALVRDAKSRGMRIIQDVSFAHVGQGFPALADIDKNGRASRFAPWFVWGADGKLVHYGRRTDAPLLDQTHQDVQALALEAISLYAKLGVSGLRLDMTAEVPLELGQRIRTRFRELVPDGVVFGEVVPQHAWRWRAANVIDAATDFGFHEVVTDLVCLPSERVDEAFVKLARYELLRGGDSHVHAVRFLSTHDHARLATLASVRGGEGKLALAYVMLFTLPGIPMLLYGEELGLRAADYDPDRDPEDVWPDRMPMPWLASAAHGADRKMRSMMRELVHARNESEALRSGSFVVLFTDESTVVYRREVEGEVVDVALNFARQPKTIELEDDDRPVLTPISAVGGALAMDQTVAMPPCSAIIARRERALGRSTVSPLRARRNLALRDHDLVLGSSIAMARPSRFFFSVTERCNLRCAHCITNAPERTKDGTARTMTPAVLDALATAGDLGLADYFAFVHGGESLTAPIFFDVLSAIKSARGGEPYVAHLLTNGVLLTVPTAEKLVKLGVSSISVSLDGATEATNDAIRLGGRFHDVRENLRRVLAWRIREGIDVRIGLSSVILQQNLHELDAIVELGADLGLDWIKLEEGVPATDFAKRSLVSLTTPDARRVIDRAMKLGQSRGLVMVDHTVDIPVWRCKLDADPRARAFLEADEMANRCMIHPCRTPFETVCIEPNGDVRARDFYGPILGNVTQESLAEMWNGHDAQNVRRDSMATRLCGTGPVTCVTPEAPARFRTR